MIIACPSCATRTEQTSALGSGFNKLLHCQVCGHNWIETDAAEQSDKKMHKRVDHSEEPDHEVQRLLGASLIAQQEFIANRRKKRVQALSWTALIFVGLAPFAAAAMVPEHVVRLVPGSIKLFKKVGMDINLYGLELRRIDQKQMIVDGSRILAVKGDIVNISEKERKIPWLRFALHDKKGREIYHWMLDSATRPLRPGEATSFVTRLSAPPEAAQQIEIRFAHANEIASNAQKE